MKISDITRIFFPDIRPLHDSMMRSLVARECTMIPSKELILRSLTDEAAYNQVIADAMECFPERVERARKAYEEFVRNSEFSESDGSFDDFLYSNVVYGYDPSEYYLFGVYRMPLDKRDEYITNRDRFVISKGLNDIVDRGDLANKHIAYRKASSLYQRDAVVLGHRGQENEFKAFMQKHHAAILKISEEMEGEGISLVREEDIHNYGAFYKKNIYGRTTLLEELIPQSKELAALNPSSVNTVRVIVFLTHDGPRALGGFIKLGHKGSVVDNASQGGVFADVDVSTGIVATDGADLYNQHYTMHPDHGYVIKGIQLPDWDGAINLVSKASRMFHTMKYVGWDIAHTANGWVLVEGNTMGMFRAFQMAHQRGAKDDVRRLILQVDSANSSFVLERI